MLILLALAAAVAAAVALGTHGGKQSVSLDGNMPPLLVQQTLGLLSTSTDPAELTGHAMQLQLQYPIAAQALLARAAVLTAQHATAAQVAATTPGAPPATTPAPSTQAPGVPPTSLGALDPTIDATTSQAVLAALSTETDPAHLLGFASSIQDHYPMAAAALTTRAAGLTAAHQASNAAGVPVAPAEQSKPAFAPSSGTTTSGAGFGLVPIVLLGAGALAALAFASKSAKAATTPAGGPSPAPSPDAGPGPSPAPGPGPSAADQGGGIVAAVPASPVSTPPPTQAPAPDASSLGAAAAPPANAPVPAGVTPAAPPDTTRPIPGDATPKADGTWLLATDGDVSRDGTAEQFQKLLQIGQVGDTSSGTFNGRTWQFRVISKDSDPSLTSYAKDVKGWIWQPTGAPPLARAATAAPPVLVPVVTAHTMANAPASSPIRTLQHKLNVLQIVTPPLAEDGINGPKTIAGTKTFQSTHGLTVDGIAGPQTNAALDLAIAAMQGKAAPAPTPGPRPAPQATPAPMTAVQIQHALNVLGFTSDDGKPLVEDGKIGPKSTQAVMSFQNAQGLTVDGKPGPQTQASLQRELAASSPTQAASGMRYPGRPVRRSGGNPWRVVA